jgi:hypothetical protein
MVAEEMLIVIIYITGVMAGNGSQGAVVVAWLGVLTLMVSVDLVGIYTEKFGSSRKEANKPYIKKIRTLWDHDLSLKSLAETNTD